MSDQEKQEKQKLWLELKIGDEKTNLNYRGTTETGSKRYVSEGDEPYAFYVNAENKTTALFKIKKDGDSHKNESVCTMFLQEGKKDDKDYFFLSNGDKKATLNIHGHKEAVEGLKAEIRQMNDNAKKAAEDRKNKDGDEPAPAEEKKKRPKP